MQFFNLFKKSKKIEKNFKCVKKSTSSYNTRNKYSFHLFIRKFFTKNQNKKIKNQNFNKLEKNIFDFFF